MLAARMSSGRCGARKWFRYERGGRRIFYTLQIGAIAQPIDNGKYAAQAGL